MKKRHLINQDFINRMEQELQNNSYKGNWKDWKPTPIQAISELHYHTSKLIRALELGNDAAQISELSADIANIASKISEVYGD